MSFINCSACGKRFSEFAPECPFCKTRNVPAGTVGDPYNGPEFLPSGSAQKSSEIVGFFLHVLPWAGGLLLLFMSASYMKNINWVVIILSAVLMALESGQLGSHGVGSAILWFFGAVVLWIVFYPLYMFRRARYGVSTNGVVCLLGALFLAGISFKHGLAIMAQQGGM